jgi:hypothetical protein
MEGVRRSNPHHHVPLPRNTWPIHLVTLQDAGYHAQESFVCTSPAPGYLFRVVF